MMKAEPQREHRWLQRLIGEWTMEAECGMGPGQPAARTKGVERVRALGDLWIVGEGTGEMPGGGTGHSIITLGYDPQKGRYVGTWIGSMMTHLWIYDGEIDAAGRVLTLSAEGPSMTGGDGRAKYQDIIEIVSDDHRILRSRVLANGEWKHFMTAHYRREK